MSRRDGLEPTDNLQALPDVEKITKVWIDWRHKTIRVQWRGRLNRPIWDVHLPPSEAKRLALWIAGILADNEKIERDPNGGTDD